MLQYIVLFYISFINLIGFAIMGIDKQKARKNQWRIREKTLFIVAIIGGSIGSILGMKCFHHKTKHKTFTYGMPLILVTQVLLIYLIQYLI
ncbi:MAG: hypothetical protein K0S41_861 [Anaerocolumna sp.]|jgi:uncharacterized membrane protein YsdA (DUF1294 family)|nr:hypothetical protein [Anaerocolumna sp.]